MEDLNTIEKPKIKFFKKHISKIKILSILILFVLLSIISQYLYDALRGEFSYYEYEDETNSIFSSYDEDTECNVLGINLHGDMYTYIPDSYYDSGELLDLASSDEITYYLLEAEKEEKIKAIILEVDSVGGYPVAGEEIANTIKSLTKPVVAFIRQSGTSAAYWSVITADKIFASKNSDVGSIGVTMSYLENVKRNQEDGLEYIQLISGKYKDIGNPDKPLTKEEKELIARDLKIVHENFIEEISKNRNIPIEKVRSFADGSSMLGEKAKELGLIDEIGGHLEAKEYVEEIIGTEATLCWY